MQDERSLAHDRPAKGAADASARVQFRRGLVLTLMTVFMPGSAQLVMGNKRVGRIAVRIWLASLGFAVIALFLLLLSRSRFLTFFTNATVLTLGRWLLILGAIAWIGLMADAWRLARPAQMARGHRAVVTGLNAALCLVTALVMFFAAHLVAVQNDLLGSVLASNTVSGPHQGRFNILLLGADSGQDRSGLRPDSLNVASIDADTGRTVLIGLPRNLQDIPFPEGSVMHQQFPNGFDCEGCELNSINTWADDHADLFKEKNPGIPATIGAVEEITGLQINYYAMVNMKGFSQLIDAVGGVEIDVKERTAIGGIGSPIRGYIEPGKRKLSGDHALWYARSRVENDDWSRMGRQKCVMTAMLRQLSPRSVLLHAQEIADSSKALLTTSIPRKQLGELIDLALKAKDQKISSVSLVPPVIYTGNPDYAKVRRLISEAIDRAEGKKASALVTANLKEVTLADEPEPGKDPRQANQSEDLDSIC